MHSVRKLPLWMRYAVAVSTAAILFLALVTYVRHHNPPLSEPPAAPSKSQLRTEQQEDRIVVEQQQAPHVVKLAAGATPRSAASRAVSAYMSAQVSHGFITGPLDGSATCSAGGGSTGRLVFHCRVTAGQAETELAYPFDAVVERAAAKVTLCQVVTPPIPSMRVPVKAACV